MNLIIGNKYKCKYEPHILVYIGEHNGWNQFTLNGKIYWEALDSELWMLEQLTIDFELNENVMNMYDNAIFCRDVLGEDIGKTVYVIDGVRIKATELIRGVEWK